MEAAGRGEGTLLPGRRAGMRRCHPSSLGSLRNQIQDTAASLQFVPQGHARYLISRGAVPATSQNFSFFSF
eukprot:2623391-Rhodomonas_salina.3